MFPMKMFGDGLEECNLIVRGKSAMENYLLTFPKEGLQFPPTIYAWCVNELESILHVINDYTYATRIQIPLTGSDKFMEWDSLNLLNGSRRREKETENKII